MNNKMLTAGKIDPEPKYQTVVNKDLSAMSASSTGENNEAINMIAHSNTSTRSDSNEKTDSNKTNTKRERLLLWMNPIKIKELSNTSATLPQGKKETYLSNDNNSTVENDSK